MKFHRLFYLSVFTSIFFIAIGWNVWLYTLPNHISAWNYIYNVIYGTIFFMCGVISVMYASDFGFRTNLGKMILFFGLGMIFDWAGGMIWVYYNLVLSIRIPYPSFADASYMLFAPCFVIGTLYMIQLYQTQITKRLIIDSILIICIAFIIIFGLFARPDLSAGLSFIEKFTNIYYPFSDVIFASMALIVLRIGRGKAHPSLYVFTSGIALQTIADLLFAYRSALGVYWNGDISDLFYTVSAFIISIGMIEIINSLYKAIPLENLSVTSQKL